MNILIDINHPAHVHYFRYLYKKLIYEGNNVIVVSRNKEIEQELLSQYDIPFISRGKGALNVVGKVIYHVYAVSVLLKLIHKHNVEKVISFMHPYGAQAAWIFGKKSILFSDSEHASMHHKLSIPFATEVHTPACFEKDLGRKHHRFNSFMELSYLHPNYFTPDDSVLLKLDIDDKKPLTIIRFVSWGAVHDIGYSGILKEDKIKLVNKISEISNVFISSEGELPDEIKKYELNIDKTKMHNLLHYADLFIGESATMASECAMLGTPSIYLNSLKCGYLNYLDKKYSIVYNFNEKNKNIEQVTDKAISILNSDKEKYQAIRKKILEENIDTSEYIYETVCS